MINPNRVHRSRATIVEIGFGGRNFKVRLANSTSVIDGWDLPKGFALFQEVNIQAQFSICLDRYNVKTVNKTRDRKAA